MHWLYEIIMFISCSIWHVESESVGRGPNGHASSPRPRRRHSLWHPSGGPTHPGAPTRPPSPQLHSLPRLHQLSQGPVGRSVLQSTLRQILPALRATSHARCRLVSDVGCVCWPGIVHWGAGSPPPLITLSSPSQFSCLHSPWRRHASPWSHIGPDAVLFLPATSEPQRNTGWAGFEPTSLVPHSYFPTGFPLGVLSSNCYVTNEAAVKADWGGEVFTVRGGQGSGGRTGLPGLWGGCLGTVRAWVRGQTDSGVQMRQAWSACRVQWRVTDLHSVKNNRIS